MSEKETFTYSEYHFAANKKSRYVRDAVVSDPENDKVGCPRCHYLSQGDIPHGKTRRCSNCGLMMQRYGNALEIWE